MRVLLVNPWIYDFAAYDLWAKPVGLISVASQLRALGCDVALIDCLDRFHPFMDEYKTKETIYGDGHYYVQEAEKPACLSDIPRSFKQYGMPRSVFNRILEKMQKPDVILVNSGLTYWYLGAFFVIKMLKEKFQETPIILGGVYASLCFEHALVHSGADCVFQGNAMADLIATIQKITKKSMLEDTHGHRAGAFNISAYDLYPRLRYITLFTSQGCVFSCSYCGWKRLSLQYRAYEPRAVAEAIVHFRTTHNVENFAFYDDAMLYNASKHFCTIVKEILKVKIRCNFHTPNGLHCCFITSEVARLMREANFVHPRLGLETIDPRVQKESGGKVATKEFVKSVHLLRDAGYASADIEVNVLVGMVQQKFNDVLRTVDFLKDCGVRIHLEEYSPVPYSDDFAKTKLRLDDDPLHHNNTAFVLRHPEFSTRLQALKDKVHVINSSLN